MSLACATYRLYSERVYRVPGAILPPPPSFVTHYWKAEPQSGPPVPTHAFSPIEYRSVTLFESRTTIESGTTGLRTWRASFVLAQLLIRDPSTMCTVDLFPVFIH